MGDFFEEDTEFPEEEEALPIEAESLIKRLLEKDPVERLGSAGGAQQVCFLRIYLCFNRHRLQLSLRIQVLHIYLFFSTAFYFF